MKKNRTLRRTLTAILAAAAIVSAGNYAGAPFTATTVQAAVKKPAAVKNLRAAKTAERSFTVKWAKVKNAVRYNVKVCKGTKPLKNKNVKTNKLTVTGLQPGTTYTVKVTNFTKVKKQQVASAVATLKVKTEVAAKPAPETPSVPQEPSVTAPETPSVPQEPDAPVEEEPVKPSITWPWEKPEVSPEGIPYDVPPEELPLDGVTIEPWEFTDKPGQKVVYVRLGNDIGVNTTLESYLENHEAYETWRDAFIATQVTDGMTDLEKCTAVATYMEQCLDYDNVAISDCRCDVYECFARGKVACSECAMILGDFLGHMGIDSQDRSVPQLCHATTWAMLDGQAYIVDATVHSAGGDMTYYKWSRYKKTTLPKHGIYTEDLAAGTCTITLTDGTEQTLPLAGSFPDGSGTGLYFSAGIGGGYSLDMLGSMGLVPPPNPIEPGTAGDRCDYGPGTPEAPELP